MGEQRRYSEMVDSLEDPSDADDAVKRILAKVRHGYRPDPGRISELPEGTVEGIVAEWERIARDEEVSAATEEQLDNAIDAGMSMFGAAEHAGVHVAVVIDYWRTRYDGEPWEPWMSTSLPRYSKARNISLPEETIRRILVAGERGMPKKTAREYEGTSHGSITRYWDEAGIDPEYDTDRFKSTGGRWGEDTGTVPDGLYERAVEAIQSEGPISETDIQSFVVTEAGGGMRGMHTAARIRSQLQDDDRVEERSDGSGGTEYVFAGPG